MEHNPIAIFLITIYFSFLIGMIFWIIQEALWLRNFNKRLDKREQWCKYKSKRPSSPPPAR